ncbi:MAG: transporter substrate-binding domain-containing protein [Desulfobacterales bacterium]|nr:transporter substrate-binding domain-containing protein [Desulfobacterales bacterium]
MKKDTRLAVLLVVLLGVCYTPAHLQAGELVVGTSTGYPPYYFVENGEMKGVCVAVVNRAAQLLGKQVVYKQYPWKRMLKYGKTGEVDAVMPLFKTPAREQFLVFPDMEIALEENSFFTRKGSGINFTGALRDLVGHPIGIVVDYSYGSAFDTADYLKKIVTENDSNLMQMFKFKRFPIGLGNRQVVRYFARKTGGIDDLVFLEPPITKAPLYIAFSKAKGHEKLTADFSKALRKFKNTRAYQNILKSYGVDP